MLTLSVHQDLNKKRVMFLFSAFRKGGQDSEGEGARHLQREEGNGTQLIRCCVMV